jgi:hypothetical protein
VLPETALKILEDGCARCIWTDDALPNMMNNSYLSRDALQGAKARELGTCSNQGAVSASEHVAYDKDATRLARYPAMDIQFSRTASSD